MNARGLIWLALANAAPAPAQCLLCGEATQTKQPVPVRPLSIIIDSALDFSRAAHVSPAGSGTIDLDERNGTRTVRGLVDLGGVTLLARVRLTGEPFGRVRIDLPKAVALTSNEGSAATVSQLKADVPPVATLDAAGVLTFTLGGKLSVVSGAAGEFRGRIAITVDYQ